VNFKGKNVIVTGGSKGLGYEICKHFLQQGANVSMCARNALDLFNADNSLMQFKTEKQILHSMSVDVSDHQSIKEYIFEAESALGEIDILVSNAGVIGSKGLIENVNIEEWTQSVAINLFSNLYLFNELVPKMKKNNKGRIVVISGGGATKPLVNMSAYGASKAGLVRLAETVAKECEDFNIKINCLAPGALNTSILEEMLENKENIDQTFYEKCLNQKEKGGDSIEHAAKVCLRLCEDDVIITGKLISAVWDDLESIICENIDQDIYTLRRLT
jgi:3-oxoacyl-[acyl-carrier protein] reductase